MNQLPPRPSSGMIPPMPRSAYSTILIALAAFAASAGTVAVPAVPESAFADTEAVTNAAVRPSLIQRARTFSGDIALYATPSNALEVAQRYGLPSSIIKYARFLKDQSRSEEDRLIEQLETQVSENTRLQEELQKKIAQAEEKEARLKKEENRLAREKDRLKAQYEKEAQEYLESVREEADAILARLRSQQDVKYHEMIELRHEIDGLREDSQQEEVPERDYEYKVGDAVELRDNDQVCEVIKIGRKDLTILMNGREIRVKKNQIRPSTHIIPKMKKQPSATIHIASHDIFASMPSQCNLIGMRVDEAKEAMADYFDQAKLHGLKNFRIIHGDGTGRLRKAVHEKLRNDPSVKEFRLGMPQEGGTGATVVELK